MKEIIAELIGTALLILLGDGVVAAVVLAKSKAFDAGWIVVATGWGLAVAIAVYAVGPVSGAHINPAVTLALASTGAFEWALVPGYIVAQIIGGILGGVLVYLHYLPHWRVTEDPEAKLAVFATAPAIRHSGANIMSEIIGTFVLVFGIFAIAANFAPEGPIGNETLAAAFNTTLAPFLVGVLVWSIGLSLGGPTGYAINPARDLGPRIAHAILPIAGKGPSDWGYAWIPILGPVIGGVLGGLTFTAILG